MATQTFSQGGLVESEGLVPQKGELLAGISTPFGRQRNTAGLFVNIGKKLKGG